MSGLGRGEVADEVFPHADFDAAPGGQALAHRIGDWVGVIAVNRAAAKVDVERYLHEFLERGAESGRRRAMRDCRILWVLTLVIVLAAIVLLVR